MSTRKSINIDPKKRGGLVKFLVPAFIILVLFLILTNTTFITIDSGEKGVVFKRFGGGLDKERVLDQGLKVIMPWNKLFKYNVRVQETFEEMNVLSRNGLNIQVDLSCRYFPIPNKIGHLHDEVGQDYLRTIILPELRSATREVIGKYLPDELYSTKREAIQEEIFTRTKENAAGKHLEIDDVLIRGVELPVTLQDAIERKLNEEQSSLEYEFRLERERKESERKLIEAEANAEANRIISASLTDKILKDKGIEATLLLANSPNSKVVIIGGSENGGLPLILNN